MVVKELDDERIEEIKEELGEPKPYEYLPQYTLEPLEKQTIDNLHRAIYLSLDLIKEKRREREAKFEKEDIPEEVKQELEKSGGPVRQEEKVKCGKDDCNSCPHGPYTYEYEWIPGEGVVSRYIGKANLAE